MCQPDKLLNRYAKFTQSKRVKYVLRKVGAKIKALDGYLNQRWPEWLQPQILDFAEEPYGPFASHHKLTGSGDVILVPTPGHSLGHLSVILLEKEHSVFFAGDTSYTGEILLVGKIDGVSAAPELQLETQERVRQYAATRPTVYLPSHDPGSEERLWRRQVLPLDDLQIH